MVETLGRIIKNPTQWVGGGIQRCLQDVGEMYLGGRHSYNVKDEGWLSMELK